MECGCPNGRGTENGDIHNLYSEKWVFYLHKKRNAEDFIFSVFVHEFHLNLFLPFLCTRSDIHSDWLSVWMCMNIRSFERVSCNEHSVSFVWQNGCQYGCIPGNSWHFMYIYTCLILIWIFKLNVEVSMYHLHSSMFKFHVVRFAHVPNCYRSWRSNWNKKFYMKFLLLVCFLCCVGNVSVCFGVEMI